MMTDTIFNVAMVMFALLMWLLVLHKHVPTGFFGSLGCVTMSLAAIFSIDDSMFRTINHIESTIFAFCFGVGLVALQVFIALHRTRVSGPEDLHRRRDDWERYRSSSGRMQIARMR
jgi:hypothetical protein